MTHQGSKSFNVYHTSVCKERHAVYAALIAREVCGDGEFLA